MKKVLVVFFSGCTPGAFKGERVHKYLELFERAGVSVSFLGVNFKSSDNALSIEYPDRVFLKSSILAKLADLLFFRLINRFLPCTLRRSVLCDLISYEAIFLLRTYKPDVVFTQPYFFPLVRNAKTNGVKVVMECDSDYPQFMWDMLERSHNEAQLYAKDERDPWDYYPYVKKANKAIAYADKVIVFSEHAQNTFVRAGTPESKIITHTPPVSSIGEHCGARSFVPEFVWIGNHGARKGLQILFQAWKAYKSKGGVGKLFVCGNESPSQRIIRKRLQQLTDVEILGKVDVSDFLSGSLKVLISVSYSEGFPRTVLEAMQHGCPVIANDVGGGGIISHKHDGWLVDLDSDSLCEGLLLVEKSWESAPVVGRNARKAALQATSGYYNRVISEVVGSEPCD